jgi:hypothetical protein
MDEHYNKIAFENLPTILGNLDLSVILGMLILNHSL